MNATASVNSVGLTTPSRDCIRLARIQRHSVVGGVAILSAIILVDHVNGLSTFLVFVVAVRVAVSSFAKAVDAGFGQFYGWLYGEPTRLTGWDRVVYRIVHRQRPDEVQGSGSRSRSPMPWAGDRTDFAESKVRVLPITGSETDL